jgi:hypothetical protein
MDEAVKEKHGVEETLCRARYSGRVWLSSVPLLYLPFARIKYRSVPNRLVERDTELVIEGFQRSGNTFAVFAFEMAQDRPIKSAHHLHASAQVIRAVKLGVPVLLLVRDPRDAIVSHVIREPCANMPAALRAWIHFYERAIPMRDRIFVADFSRLSTDFGAVIRDFNEKFGTGYKEFHHTDDNVARCFDKIEERNRQRYGRLVEGKVARPSEERRGRKDELNRQFEDSSLSPQRVHAYEVYRALVPATEPA